MLFLRRLEVPVVLRDIEQERIDSALESIRGDVKPFLATILEGGTDWAQFEGCDLVLEAVFAELELKREVLAEVREVAPEAVLATNTSSLSVEGMGADVGLHFFNPVAVMPLVEIVRTSRTTDNQLATAWDVVSKLKKRGVLVGDAPGFVVNRLLTRMTTVLAEAIASGNTVEDVDDAILSLGLPMAPSVLREMVGPAVAQHVLETMHASWPDRFPLTPPGGGERRTLEEIRERALEAVTDEVQHLLAEGVVADPADVDACLILGAGWPLFLGGAVTRSGKIEA
jgi:3-hydroxyacyl-CoA dehydrogenase